MKKKITIDLFRALVIAALEEKGYDVISDDTGYIHACPEEEGKPELLLAVISRCLSNGERRESPQVLASRTLVEKLKTKADSMAGDVMPCVAFGVARYSYFDCEVCVVPVMVWDELAETGGVYSKTAAGVFYNYQAAGELLPQDAVLRVSWEAKEY